jgi:DNA-binding response OmpR family regulator
MGAKILIAEDEPNIVASLEFLLLSKDYEICIARDGAEALELVERFRPDLVLLDVMMPLRNGFDVCRTLRGNPELKGLKIVMLSARGRDEEQAQGLALGADAYVTKPFSTRELLAKVGELLPEAP